MSDWQVGDLAVCIDDGPRQVDGWRVMPAGPLSAGRTYTVRSTDVSPLGKHRLILCTGTKAYSDRFRKIRPDEHEACEEEFVILLKRSRKTVSA